MRLLCITCGFLLFLATGQAQKPIEIGSKVNHVVTYPQGAMVEHTASKQLSAGRQWISFVGLASELDASSLSVSAGQGVSVLSVSSQVNHLREPEKPRNVQLLEDSLEKLDFDYKFNQNMLAVYTEERNMILANKDVGWGGARTTGFRVEDIEDLSEFYRDRLADIMLKSMQIEQKQVKLNKTIQRMRNQLREQNAKLNRATGEVMVEVHVASSALHSFSISYMVHNAGWVPFYNVRVVEVDQPLQVGYGARVFQNTGIDWNEATLTLTNAMPSLGGNKPELHPWRLNFVYDQPVALRGARMDAKYKNEAAPMAAQATTMDMEEIALGASISYAANQAVTQFQIRTRQTIPSNGKPQVIAIDDFTVPAKFEYYCAPKVDPAAFLLARVAGFEKLDLLPGEANLFLGNTYVGKAFLDPSVTTDTLDLSLGRDQSIVVKRTKVKEFSATKRVGSSTRQSVGIEISVRNNKATKVQLIIEDQVPVSGDKDIEVSAEDVKSARHIPETGMLRWTRTIPAGSIETMQFRYSVKYPSDRKINH